MATGVQPPGRRDPATEFRYALIDILTEHPHTSALADRRLLISLIRSEARDLPELGERAEARLHVIEIVNACHKHPGGLAALFSGLAIMSPEHPGTRKAQRLFETTSLAGLLPEAEIHHATELLRRPEILQGQAWRQIVEELAPQLHIGGYNLSEAFDQLTRLHTGQHVEPPALALIGRLADKLDGPIAADLRRWYEEQSDRLWFTTGTGAPPPPGESAPVNGGQPPEEAAVPADDSARVPVHAGGMAHDSLGEDITVITQMSDSPSTLDDGDVMASVASTRGVAETERLPQVWGDVPPRNPHFTGREALLTRLHEDLRATRATAVLPQSLHGMGGVGKSQVAIEFVHRHRSDFDLVWWVPSEQPGLVLSSLTKLAQRLDLDAGPEANTAVPAVKEALSTGQTPYTNWLLIFDNAEDLNEVRRYFPTGGAGKILVTSRNPEWAGVTRTLEVDVFPREESIQFLRTRTPELSDEDADRLAEALGDLPLAIEQAAAWRAATGMPVNDYLSLLEAKRIELLEDSVSPDYDKPVAAAWNMSLDKLEETNLSALQLLQVCSFFAPEPISRELFAGSPIAPITPELDTMLSDPIRLARAIRDIQRYALARFDHRNDTLQMHRLVQTVLVGRMNDEQRDLMRKGAHTLLASGDPLQPGRRSRWNRYQGLLPHVQVSRAVESDDPRVQEMVFRTVEFLYHWGDHEGCERLASEAYGYWFEQLGESHPRVLQLAKYLGYIQWVLGRYDRSEPLHVRTLEIYQRERGAEDEGTLDAMYMVAINLRAKGNFIGARELDESALEISRRQFGTDDPVTLRAAHSLGVSLRLTGEFQRAAELDDDTHQISVRVFGPDAEPTLRTLNGLVIDQREAGDYIGAHARQEEVYRQCLAATGGERNPVVILAARNLAVSRRKAGNHEGARTLAEATMERLRRRYGDDYPDTIAAAVNLAVDLRHADAREEARELGESTLDRYKRLFGPNHLHTLSAQANLAIVRRLLGDAPGAYELNKQTLDGLTRAVSRNHPVTLTCATNLASDLFALGDPQGAFERDTDTLARSERLLGSEHPSTLAIAVNLALDLRELGREQAADKIHADAMGKYRKILGDRHPATLNAREGLRADCDVDPMPI